jgi:hypothetical protein
MDSRFINSSSSPSFWHQCIITRWLFHPCVYCDHLVFFQVVAFFMIIVYLIVVTPRIPVPITMLDQCFIDVWIVKEFNFRHPFFLRNHAVGRFSVMRVRAGVGRMIVWLALLSTSFIVASPAAYSVSRITS